MKVKVGDSCCMIDDAEEGCSPFALDCPIEDIKFSVSCKHQNHNYMALRCDYFNHCDYKREIIESDLRDFPALFEQDNEQ